LKSPTPDTPWDEGTASIGGTDGPQLDRKNDSEIAEVKNEANVIEDSLASQLFNSPMQTSAETMHIEISDTTIHSVEVTSNADVLDATVSDDVVIIPYKRPSSSKKRKKVEISGSILLLCYIMMVVNEYDQCVQTNRPLCLKLLPLRVYFCLGPMLQL